jgi:polar amino acid transport system substrate-binding protein
MSRIRLNPKWLWRTAFILLWVLPACLGKQSTAITPVGSPPISKQTARVIRITNGEWVPYTGEYLEHNGCDSWTVAEAFATQGVTVQYGFFPWARGYELASTGVWDATVMWADTPEHRKDFYLSAEPLSHQNWVFFYRVGEDFTWKELENLHDKRIGLTSGYVYSDVFADLRNQPDMKFEEAASDQANFDKLLNGRIDIFPMEELVGQSILTNYFTQDEQARITFQKQPITAFEPYLLLSRSVAGNDELIKLFDAGWKELKDNGRYAEITQNCARLQVTPH